MPVCNSSNNMPRRLPLFVSSVDLAPHGTRRHSRNLNRISLHVSTFPSHIYNLLRATTITSSMAPSLILLFLLFLFVSPSHSTNPLLIGSTDEFRNFTRISDFRLVNRRVLGSCPDLNPYLAISVSPDARLPDEGQVTVTVSGVLFPSKSDWIAMITPANADVTDCPLNEALYVETGDISSLPLLCHYPVKAQWMRSDPSYLTCANKECKKSIGGTCLVHTCSGSLTFHVVNIRTPIEFVFFTAGFDTPCLLRRSGPIAFANPAMPLYGHLSSIDSTGTSMRVTWVSGDKKPQTVQYANGKWATSAVATFTQDEMCSNDFPSPAKNFGWHEPGFIHSAIMEGLQPSQSYYYRYGSDSVGWSARTKFKTPPAAGMDELRFLAYGDMGKAPRDPSIEHYIQPGSISVIEAMKNEVTSGVDSIFHIGDISYATGFLVEWDFFLDLIKPIASHVSYMTTIGNHERDYANSGSVYDTPDSGGECGVPYETYFQMPTLTRDKPWYSIKQASVHFTIISTEHDWTENSEQYEWIKKDLASVDREITPWLIFAGHRPMYSSVGSVDSNFVNSIEPLLIQNKVDLALFGHVHNYERTCAVYQNECNGMPKKDNNGIDTYDNNNYTAPVHAVIGMAGFSLDNFPIAIPNWSLSRVAEFGYARIRATKTNIGVELVNSYTREVQDSFQIIKEST